MSERRFSLPSLRPFAAILSLSLALSSHAAVYAPGLLQAKFTTGQEDRTNDIASATSTAYAAGTIMANTTGAAKDWDGTSWAWSGNSSFGYLGEMWMESGTTYTFGKSVDDWTYVKINGEVLLDNSTWNGFNTCDYTPTATGWVPVEFRFGNGGGGAGVSQSAKYGFAYNTEGNKSWDAFKPANAPWKPVLDPGDCSLLRVIYPQMNDVMKIENVAVDGADLVITASFAGLTGSGTLTAYYGPGDGGQTPNSWDHCATVATVSAGDTAATPYRLAGAGAAAFISFRLSAQVGTAMPIQQWTDTYSLAPDAPAFKLVGTDVGYTNLSFAATCLDIGQGASSVEADVQLALDDSFADIVQTRHLALSGLGNETVAFAGLATNTTYYARVVGTNDLLKTGGSSKASGTTLTPGDPECAVESVVSGLTTLSVTGRATEFGAGSTSATMRLEASTSADFATLAGFAETNATLGGSTTLVVAGLAPDTEYRLRLRLVNEWGLEASTNLLPVSTLDAPIVASGIRRTFASDISTVDVFFDITDVFDGATGTATLYCDESDEPTTNRGERAVSAPGTLAWAAIPFGGNAYHAKVVLVSEANGVVYTQTWAAVVDHSFKRFRPVKFDMDPNCVDVDEPGKPIWHPEYAFDGDYSTGASAETGCSVIGKLAEMLDVPQDQEVYVTRIDVTLDGNSRYSLYTSEDGTTWELVEGATNVTHSGTASYAISTVANFVKCTFESSSGGPKSLLEVEAWGFVKEKPRVVSRWEIASFHNEDGSPMTADGGGGNNGSWGGTSPKKRMFDNNFTSYQMWPKAGKNGYVMVDFTKNTGSGTDLQEYFVTELWVGADGTKKFTLQYSEDGANWQDVDGAVGITCEGIGKYTVCKTVKAVRYVWTDGSYNNFSDEYLAEFQVWGINPNDAPCDHPKYSEWEIGAVPASCTERARDQRKCLVCGAKFARISAGSSPLGHDYVTTLDRPGHFSQRKDFLDHRRYGAGSITCSRCTFRLDFPSALDLVTNRVDGVRVCGEKTEGIVRFTDLSVSSENHPEWGPGKKKLIDEVWNVSQEWPYWMTVSTNAQCADFEFGTTVDLTEVELSVYNHGYRFDFCSVDDDEETETTFCSISISHEEATEAKLETIEVDVPGTGRTKEIPVQKMATDDYQRVRIPFFETPINHLRIRIVDEEPADLWGSKGIRVIEIHPWGTVRGASDYPSAKTTMMILR